MTERIEFVGKRIQVPVLSPQWNKGDRYGTVVDQTKEPDPYDDVLLVRMEKSLEHYQFKARDCSEAPELP